MYFILKPLSDPTFYVTIPTLLLVGHADAFYGILFPLKNAVFSQRFEKYSFIQPMKEEAIIVSFWKWRG